VFWFRQGKVSWRSSNFSCVLLVAISTNALLAAERPELTLLFPPGGQAGTVVNVEATGKFPVWPIQVWSDTDSIHWSCEESSGKLKATIDASAKPGLYWLRLYHPNGATSVRPFLVSDMPEQTEVEPNNRVAEANAVASFPACIQGVLGKRGDVDMVSVMLTAGQKLVATVDASNLLRSPVDAILQLLDPDGFVIAENLDHFGLDPSLEFLAPRDGRYFVRVFGFPSAPDSTIAFGGGADWIYRLRLQSVVAPVLDPSSNGSLGSEAIFRTMEYGESISRDTAISIEVPARLRGTIAQSGQQNYVRFKGVAGQSYRIQLRAREFGSALDATIAVLDAQGKQLSQQDDVGNVRDPDLKWKAPADGDYLIEVSDFHQTGGPDYGFELLVSAVLPDFSLSVPNDLIQVVVGKETEIQVKLNREGNFAGEILVSLQELPEGVDCPVVKSIQGNDTEKKLTLKVKSTVPFQGPMKISAKAVDLQGSVRIATTDDEKPMWLSSIVE